MPPPPPPVLCCSPPYESSEGAEYWAVRAALQRLNISPQSNRVCFLVDDDQAKSTLACAIRLGSSNEPLPPASPLWARVFWSLLSTLPEPCVVHSAWIKGHAGFAGNEVSDYFSKWAAHALQWHRPLPQPPSSGASHSTSARCSPPPPPLPPMSSHSSPSMLTPIFTIPSVLIFISTPASSLLLLSSGRQETFEWHLMNLIGIYLTTSALSVLTRIHWTLSRLSPSAVPWIPSDRICFRRGPLQLTSSLQSGGNHRASLKGATLSKP